MTSSLPQVQEQQGRPIGRRPGSVRKGSGERELGGQLSALRPRGRASCDWRPALKPEIQVPAIVIIINIRVYLWNRSGVPLQLGTAFQPKASGDENPWREREGEWRGHAGGASLWPTTDPNTDGQEKGPEHRRTSHVSLPAPGMPDEAANPSPDSMAHHTSAATSAAF